MKYGRGVPIRSWTGPLDWTTGLDYWTGLDWPILGVLRELNYDYGGGVECFFASEASTTATNYSDAHMEDCNHANFQLRWVAGSWKAFSRQMSYLLINNSYCSWSLFLYLKRVRTCSYCTGLTMRPTNTAIVQTSIDRRVLCMSKQLTSRSHIFTWESCKIDIGLQSPYTV